jgi:hypothetical protein
MEVNLDMTWEEPLRSFKSTISFSLGLNLSVQRTEPLNYFSLFNEISNAEESGYSEKMPCNAGLS